MTKAQTAKQAFLAPLAKVAAKYPDIEAEVIWANEQTWEPQDDPAEWLDAEEVTFYAEGLLLEGFRLCWQVLAETSAATVPIHIRLFFWQNDGPALPQTEPDLVVTSHGVWVS